MVMRSRIAVATLKRSIEVPNGFKVAAIDGFGSVEMVCSLLVNGTIVTCFKVFLPF